jgi:hypothetical protein
VLRSHSLPLTTTYYHSPPLPTTPYHALPLTTTHDHSLLWQSLLVVMAPARTTGAHPTWLIRSSIPVGPVSRRIIPSVPSCHRCHDSAQRSYAPPRSPACAHHWLLPTTCYLLPTTYYLLPTAYYLLPTTYYPLHVVLSKHSVIWTIWILIHTVCTRRACTTSSY